jgi:hypothetical protein
LTRSELRRRHLRELVARYEREEGTITTKELAALQHRMSDQRQAIVSKRRGQPRVLSVDAPL